MKTFKVRTALAGLCALALSSAAVAQDGVELEQFDILRLNLPHGASYLDRAYNEAVDANPITVRYVVESSCRQSPTLGIDVLPEGQRRLETALPDGAGAWRHSGSKLTGIRLNFSNPGYPVLCTYRLYRPKGGTLPTERETLAGALQYEGGFANRLSMTLPEAKVVQTFRVALPAFCTGVEILEAGTVTEGVFDPATLTQTARNVFTVVGGRQRIREIVVSLNGPVEARCAIPIFLTTAPIVKVP